MNFLRAIIKTLFLIVLVVSSNSFAWIYPEHRDITLLAIQNLSEEDRLLLDQLWMRARLGHEDRLTEFIIYPEQGIEPAKLDFASWAAIAGDHSTSPSDMISSVLYSEWILDVADVAAHLKIDLASSEDRHEHVNALRDSDIKLQRVDPQYATRAGSNNVHFLLARPSPDTDIREYLTACLKPGVELNALGAYTWFHISALEKAAKSREENLTAEERSSLILAALADEGFALHFLEDSFASGHTAGTWGNASQRKGTHDYYNEKGLEVITWNGKRAVLTGDAFMRPEDAETAAKSVRLSLEQVIAAADGKFKFNYNYDNHVVSTTSDSFDVSKNNYMSKRHADPEIFDPLAKILKTTPVPGLATGLGELPRFSAELGPFIGAMSSIRGNAVAGGFGETQNQPGAIGGLDVGIRLGLGLEGVMHGGGDGLVFLEAGWRQDASSSMKFSEDDNLDQGGQITSAIPGREAINFRVRMPFYLLPLDLLITAPILLIVSPDTYASMAVSAGLGGLIPWQAGIETGIGRFQFILGREIGMTLYGRGDNIDALLIPNKDGQIIPVNYKSTQFDFPILEYRPFRTFSLDQSSSLVFQFTVGVDIPHDETLAIPPEEIDKFPEGVEAPELKPVWYIGIRTAFDWRYYW